MNRDFRFDRRLGVVTHVPHWQDGEELLAYEPYVREMRLWSGLFRDITVCAPRGEGAPSPGVAAYDTPNIRWAPVDYSGGVNGRSRAKRLSQLPTLARDVHALLRSSDVVLLRSPGHPALVARLLTGITRTVSITKWAGYFGPYAGERLPARVERILARWGSSPILVYGPATREPLISFVPAVMSRDELRRAAELGAGKIWEPPWRVLSVGRLLPVKGFDLALDGLAALRARNPRLEWTFTLVGDGDSARDLREQAERLGIADRVNFTGALPFREVQQHYGQAHVVIMPGVKEGWPKPVAEAWAHGAVPVAAAAGLVPWIIERAGTGCVFEPTATELGGALERVLGSPGELRSAAQRGYTAVQDLALECFVERLERVLVERCGLS